MIDPLLRRSVGYVRRAPTWAVAIALSTAALALASATPPLVADAAADRSFTAEVHAAQEARPGAALDARAVTTGLVDMAGVKVVSDALDELPVYGTPKVSVSPLRPYTDIYGPLPVIRTAGGQMVGIVAADDRLTASFGPGADGTSGIWIPDTVAAELHLRPGDHASVALTRPADGSAKAPPAVPVTIAGVYPTRDGLPAIDGVDVASIPGGLPSDPIAHERPARLLLADTATALRLIAAMGDTSLTTWDVPWQQPVDLEHGRRAASAVHSTDLEFRNTDSAIGTAVHAAGGDSVALHTGVGSFVDRSERAASELQPLVSSIAVTARVMSGLVLAVGAWLLSRNRRREHQLSMSMGIHPARVALTTAVELLLPVVVGVVAAYVVVRWQPQLVAGRGAIDTRTIRGATSTVLRALPVAVGLVLVAAFAAVWPLEPSAAGRARRVAGMLHADTIVIVAAVATGAQIVTQRGNTLDSGTSLLFPLFAVLAGAVIAVRVAAAMGRGFSVRRSRRGAARRTRRPRSLATWLAMRRAAAWLGELSTLVVLVAAGVGLFVYATSIASNGQRGVNDKAAALGGAPTTLSIANTNPFPDNDLGMPVGLPAKSAVVWASTNEHAGPDLRTDLLIVDPTTFPDATEWRPSFSGRSLSSLLHEIDDSTAATIPVVVAGNYNGDFPDVGVLELDRAFVHYQVVERIAAAPWIHERSSMMIMSARRLAAVLPVDRDLQPPLTPAQTLDRRFSTYVFSQAPSGDVAPIFRPVLIDEETPNTVTAQRTPSFVAFGMSLPYLRIVGIGLLVVALLSIVVLGARRRSDLAVEIAMTDRMGMRHRTTALAVAGGAVLLGLIGSAIGIFIAGRLVAFMLHRLDPGPSFSPPFTGGLSWPAVGIAVGAVVVVSVLGALLEVRGARHARVVEVLRAVE